MSGVFSPLGEYELLLEPSYPRHPGFGQKPEPKLNLKTLKNKQKFGQFLALNDSLGIEKHVVKLGNPTMAQDKTFEPIQNQTLKL